MADALGDFLKQPNETNFRNLRELVITSPDYDFYSPDLDALGELVTAGDFAGALAMMPALMPNWLLSPRVHQLLSHAAEQQGDTKTAAREAYMAKATLHGLMATGDGTQLRPYAVTHVFDEYDILEALGRQPASQRHEANAAGGFDVITSTTGVETWFDVTASVQPVR
jgi:hypothetical protein